MTPDHITYHAPLIERESRARQNGHPSLIIWLTGLSGAGKSTLAYELEHILHTSGHRTYVLDGDNVRHGLCGDLGFSRADREENIRRIGEVAKLMMDAGLIVITAFISPHRADRDRVRTSVASGEFIEIFCSCEIETCIARDPKGLYKQALSGQIRNFTGISSPYETPPRPELMLDTGQQDIASCTEAILSLLRTRGLLIESSAP